MAHKRGGQLTVSGEWARHLRPYFRRIFWKKERVAENAMLRSEISEIPGFEALNATTFAQHSRTLPRKVAVLLYPGCVYFEIEATVAALSRQFEVLHFTPDGLGLADSRGEQLTAQGSYADFEQTDVKCVIVPGGDPGSIIPEQKATAALQHAAGQGALMAGICAGNLVLASAGLLKGVRATQLHTRVRAR